jgi:hypothetical protein
MPSSNDPSIQRAARDAVMHHVDFLHSVAGDAGAPRAERLQAIELLARLAELGRAPGGGASKSATKTAAKSAGKSAAKGASKHAAKSAAKGAAEHAHKSAGERKHLAGEEGPKRLASPGTKALPPGRS